MPIKYVQGFDGGGSTVRDTLGIESFVHQTQDSWVVADVFADTDFPDARRRCAIRTGKGSIVLIPNADHGIRIYTLLCQDEVEKLSSSKYEAKGSDRKNTKTVIGIVTQRIKSLLKPYIIEIKKVEWVRMCHRAQRIADIFNSSNDRVPILGDACHTHSSKAGPGMNVSINVAYSLTWKLTSHLRGLAQLKLLQTYQMERQHIAQ